MDVQYQSQYAVNYSHEQKCREGSITLEITPLPFINAGFSRKQNGDFSSNIAYGGGGGGNKSMVFSKLSIVRIIELGVK